MPTFAPKNINAMTPPTNRQRTMRLSMLLAFMTIFSSLPEDVNAFQVTPDPSKKYKQAIEQSIGQEIKIPVIPVAPDWDCDHSHPRAPDFTIVDDMSVFSSIARPLSKTFSFKTLNSIPVSRRRVPRKRLGFDDMPTEYWFDNRIHTFGNTGFFGGFHASVAPLATWLIDEKAYEGLDARAVIAKDLRKAVNRTNAYVLDLCCGVGMSTRALASAFQDAEFLCGIDTSPEMISMARFISKYHGAFLAIKALGSGRGNALLSAYTNLVTEVKNTLETFHFDTDVKNSLKASLREDKNTSMEKVPLYAIGHAERVSAPKSKFDLVTLMYAFHEIPKEARYRVLRETRRLLKPGGILAIVDISEDYCPTSTMLAGEPYVLEYQKNIQKQVETTKGFSGLQVKNIIPGHVTMWTLTRTQTSRADD